MHEGVDGVDYERICVKQLSIGDSVLFWWHRKLLVNLINCLGGNYLNNFPGASQMAQQIKLLASVAWQPEFDPGAPV